MCRRLELCSPGSGREAGFGDCRVQMRVGYGICRAAVSEFFEKRLHSGAAGEKRLEDDPVELGWFLTVSFFSSCRGWTAPRPHRVLQAGLSSFDNGA